MATYRVTGFALGPVFCEYEVEAGSEGEAKAKAQKLFDSGDRGDYDFENDSGAFCDFEPMDCIAKPTPATPTGADVNE